MQQENRKTQRWAVIWQTALNIIVLGLIALTAAIALVATPNSVNGDGTAADGEMAVGDSRPE